MSQRATHPAAPAAENENPTQAVPSASGERDRNGRFAAGNRGGPGNPFARQVAELRKAFVTTVTPSDMLRICQRLITQAILGDTPSIKILLGYVLGKFPDPVYPDAVDQDEIRLHARNLAMEELHKLAKSHVPPRVSLAFLRGMSVVHEKNAASKLLKEGDTPAHEPAAPSAPASEAAPEGGALHLADAFTALSAGLPVDAPGDAPIPNGESGGLRRKPSPFWRQAIYGKSAKNGRNG